MSLITPELAAAAEMAAIETVTELAKWALDVLAGKAAAIQQAAAEKAAIDATADAAVEAKWGPAPAAADTVPDSPAAKRPQS